MSKQAAQQHNKISPRQDLTLPWAWVSKKDYAPHSGASLPDFQSLKLSLPLTISSTIPSYGACEITFSLLAPSFFE